jgi:hypothetical protein
MDVVQAATLALEETGGNNGARASFQLRIELDGETRLEEEYSFTLNANEALTIPGVEFLFPPGAIIEPGSDLFIEDASLLSDSGVLLTFEFVFARYYTPSFRSR